MRAVLSVWAWIAIVLTVILGFLVLVLLSPTILVDRRRRIVGRTFRLSSVVVSKLVPQWQFRRVGGGGVRPGPKTVCVCNHRSQSDPFLVSHLPWEMKWMGKANLFKIPFLGWSMRLAGDIPVHRGDRGSAQDAMAQAARWVSQGMPVMMFPEGTRSKTKDLLPFKSGAFRIAIETGADVLPLALIGTETALPKHDWKLGRSRARVCVGRPISTAGMTLDDVPRLSAMAREQIEKLVAALERAPDEVPSLDAAEPVTP